MVNQPKVVAKPLVGSKPGVKTAGVWENLLASLSPAKVEQIGHGWSLKDGELFSPQTRFATLPLPGNYADGSYSVCVKLRQVAAKEKESFNLLLPVADRRVGFNLDGFPRDGYCTGLILVNGKLGKDLPGVIEGKQVKDSEQHDLEVTVRLVGPSAVITTTLDDQRLYEWAGPVSSLSQHPSWNSPPGTLALGTATADWVVSEVKVKRLDAK